MSLFHNFKMHYQRYENVDFIVPERLKSARIYRGMDLKEAAEKLGISRQELGRMESGHQEIPKEMLFKLMKLYNFHRNYFYKLIWERV